MMYNNSLEERLNAHKNGTKIPEAPHNEHKKNHSHINKKDNKKELNNFFIIESYKIFNILLTSALYGYGLSVIFNQNWVFIKCLGIGMLLNHSALAMKNIVNFIVRKNKNNL